VRHARKFRAASRRRAKSIGPAAIVLAIAAVAPAHAAEEGGSLLYPVINFALLLAVLFYFARKPIQTYFGERRAGIRKDLDEAAALERQARERYAQWQRRLVDLERELAEIRAGAQERAEAERASLLADARAASERIRADAATAVEHELRRARAGLREEASQLAIELASGILREKVTAQDRDRLIDEFIERIAAPEASFAQRAKGERRPEGGK
jgi:F-type H+-transporting ATPase subunit b